MCIHFLAPSDVYTFFGHPLYLYMYTYRGFQKNVYTFYIDNISSNVYTFFGTLYIYIYLYTWCHKRKGSNFGRVFLMLNYTDITQNTYIQS